jgi:hypothetical protein
MIQTKDIHWLAGLVEGEGSFMLSTTACKYQYPSIQMAMTDEDVMQRAAKIMGVKVRKYAKPPWKDVFALAVGGHKATGWMMTLHPLMGERRQAKINEVLAHWRGSSSRSRLGQRTDTHCLHGHSRSAVNTYTERNGRTHCRPCRTSNQRAYMQRKQA